MTFAEVAPRIDVRGSAKEAVWLFLAAILPFVGVIVLSLSFERGRDTAQREAAEELGVHLNHLPADVFARIVRDEGHPLMPWLVTVLFMLSVGLFTDAVRTLGVVGERRGLVRAAEGLAMVAGVAFVAVPWTEQLVAREPAWLVENWWLYMGLVTLGVLALCASLALLIVTLWGTGFARRTSVVVLVLLSLAAVQMVFGAGAPPILPMILGAVYAFVVKRSIASQD